MKNFAKAALAASLFIAAATPAAAQVNGIATSSPEASIVRSKALNAAYQQIDQQYAAQIQQVRTIRQEASALQASLDTNSDQQLSDAEINANPAVIQQIQAKEQQASQAGRPIVLAQYYVIQQIAAEYTNARNQVIQAKKIQLMLSPEALQYAPDKVNVTEDITTALDTRVPTAAITPPANFQPTREVAALHQTIQQILVAAAQQQAARAGQAAQPAPATQQPTGR